MRQIQYTAQGTAGAPVEADAVREDFHDQVIAAKLPQVWAVPDETGDLTILPVAEAAGVTTKATKPRRSRKSTTPITTAATTERPSTGNTMRTQPATITFILTTTNPTMISAMPPVVNSSNCEPFLSDAPFLVTDTIVMSTVSRRQRDGILNDVVRPRWQTIFGNWNCFAVDVVGANLGLVEDDTDDLFKWAPPVVNIQAIQ